MNSKIILIKFPDNKFHTASVTRFVSVPFADQEIDTIWYKDLTEMEYEETNTVGSYSIIRDNHDGTYTNLNCGTPENYEKIYEEIKEEILNKNFKDKDLNLLPYSIDSIEDYDFFTKKPSSEVIQTEELSENIKSIKREISSRIGSFVGPSSKDTYDIEENNLCIHLNQLEEKMSSEKWEDTKNDILSYLALKKIDMNNGYILIKDAIDALKEIEEIANNACENKEIETPNGEETISFENISVSPSKDPIDDIVLEDNTDSFIPEIQEDSVIEEKTNNEIPTISNIQLDNNQNTTYCPYVKTIYVLWNELLSNLANFIYFEYDSISNTSNYHNYSYNNITDNYRHINRELLNIVKDKEITIDSKSIVTLNDKLIKYNFYIIPIDDYDVFIALKKSRKPFILTKEYEDSYQTLINALKRKNIIITETETISVIK